jgi:V/A-type H+-transporting ATPase subunit I
MKKVNLVVHQNYVEEVIKTLHEQGMMHVINISQEEPDFLEDTDKAPIHPDAEDCAAYEFRLTRLIDILRRRRKKQNGIKAMLQPELPKVANVEEQTLDELYSYAESFLEEHEDTILEYDKKLQHINERNESIKYQISQVTYLKDFGVDISHIQESHYLIVKAGITSDIDQLTQELKAVEKSFLCSRQVGSGKKIEWVVLIAGYSSEKETIEKISRKYITELNIHGLSGSPKDVLHALKKEKQQLTQQKKHLIQLLHTSATKQLDELYALREQLQIERMRKEISRNFAKTQATFIIKGWVLEKNDTKLQSILHSISDGCIIYNSKEPTTNPDNPPTFIETPRWAEGFRSLLEMFATPKYNEINPTILMGIFFVLFFGIMLGDAGYGLIIFILSLVGYAKFGKYSGMIRSWSFMGIWLGIATIVVGFLTYSIFGDLVHRFIYNNPENPIYGFSLSGIQFPVEPLNDPLTILTVALLFGLIHLNVGVVLGIYQAYKQKRYKEMLTQRFCWVFLQLGGSLLIGHFILDWQISTTLFFLAGGMVLIGIILLFISAGPVGFFDITGYVGDWLSYARLLALGLATSGMALAFNVVSELLKDMIPIQIIGVLIMVILLIILHMVNLGLQALGAAVHSLRLQYVEFFNRFYEGGGHEFTPFKIKRKYTKIEDK